MSGQMTVDGDSRAVRVGIGYDVHAFEKGQALVLERRYV
jgi:hypothetical protein